MTGCLVRVRKVETSAKQVLSPARTGLDMIRTAVFPIGGLGTRFLPATKAMPKEMLPIVDKPLIQFVVEEAKECGIERLVFVTGRQKHAVENHFDHMIELENLLEARRKKESLHEVRNILSRPGDVIFVRQMQPLGLGHAVWCARHIVQDHPFAVLLADDFIMAKPGCLRQMLDHYTRKPGNYLASMKVLSEEVSSYGIIENQIDNGGTDVVSRYVTGLKEKPAPQETPSREAVVGRYILQPEIMSVLEQLPKGAGGEIQLTDAIAEMIPSTPTFSYRFKGRRFDCGSKKGFVEATNAVARQTGLSE